MRLRLDGALHVEKQRRNGRKLADDALVLGRLPARRQDGERKQVGLQVEQLAGRVVLCEVDEGVVRLPREGRVGMADQADNASLPSSCRSGEPRRSPWSCPKAME